MWGQVVTLDYDANLVDQPEFVVLYSGSLWLENQVMQDCGEAESVPIDVLQAKVPQIQDFGGVVLGPDQVAQDVSLLVQREKVRECCQVPLGPDEVVNAFQDDAKDCDGTLRGPPSEQQDSAGALWIQDEEVQNQSGA